MTTSSANQAPRVAVITGASSGIGWQTALAFAERGWTVVPAARRKELLDKLADECRAAGAADALPVATDVADEAQVRALVQAAVDRFGRLDVMVNNAGYGLHARVHEIQTDQLRRIMDVDFFGVFYGCKAAAEVMVRQRGGHIFNVSSVIGKRGSPFNGGYSAAKFAICGLSDSMRVEMLPYNVRVTTVCPGLTKTDFFQNVEAGTAAKEASFQLIRGRQDPCIVARAIVHSVGKNRPELVFTAGGKFLVFIAAMFPRLADRMMKFYHDDIIRRGG